MKSKVSEKCVFNGMEKRAAAAAAEGVKKLLDEEETFLFSID